MYCDKYGVYIFTGKVVSSKASCKGATLYPDTTAKWIVTMGTKTNEGLSEKQVISFF